MQDFVELISKYNVIPVVRLDSLQHASPLFGALHEGGLPIAEVTLRTDCALDAIGEAARRDDFLIGAGTVLNAEQCAEALKAGAAFIVSPGFDAGVVKLCQEHNVPCFPGAATATEIQTAFNAGLRTVKFFPAESLGGAKTLAALAAPFHQMTFIPTGGINATNAIDYLKQPYVPVVGGSWLVKPELYENGDFSLVTERARNALSITY